MDMIDTIVVGGGVIGTACLYHLTERGIRDVLLIERETIACGSTGASVAMVETQYLDPNQIALTAYGKRLCDKFEREENLPFVHNGYLRIGHSPADVERFQESVELQRASGVHGASVLTADQAAALVPGLVTADLSGALWGPDDGYVDAVKYCEIFVHVAKSMGGRVLTGREVTDFLIAEDGGVAGVVCGAEEIRCNRIVNASGAWARGLGAKVSVDLPVDGYRRQVGIFEPPRSLDNPLPFIIDYVPGDDHEGLYFRDDTPGRVIAGLHWEGYADWERPEDPNDFPHGLEWEYAARLFEMLRERFAPAETYKQRGGWSGLYPMTPDGEFIVGRTPSVPRLFNALGGGGVGVQTAAGVGAVLADLMATGETTHIPNPEAFNLDRFSKTQRESEPVPGEPR
jgi:sarcosine oxidase, subunit beta